MRWSGGSGSPAGHDADTTAAIYGQLAGAYYGASGIPPEWLSRLAMRELVESYAERLLSLSHRPDGEAHA